MKKIIIFLILITSSMAYSNYRVSSSSLPILRRLPSEHSYTTIYQQNIVIIRNSVNEKISYTTPNLNILSLNDLNHYEFELGLYNQRNLGFEVNFQALSLNGGSLSSLSTSNSKTAKFMENLQSRTLTNYTAKYSFVIPLGTPDFKNKDLGWIMQDKTTATKVILGNLTLITEVPLCVTVPDIDFGDVLTTKNVATKNGNILITGKKGTNVTLSISNPKFKLSRIDKNSGEIEAQASIDGQTQGIKETINSKSNLTKNLSVTISNFSTLDSGKYSGSVTINIDSN